MAALVAVRVVVEVVAVTFAVADPDAIVYRQVVHYLLASVAVLEHLVHSSLLFSSLITVYEQSPVGSNVSAVFTNYM